MGNEITRHQLLQRLIRRDWDFDDKSHTDDIYNFHPYPTKFIPDIPKTLLQELSVPTDSLVFDPFCGYGTAFSFKKSPNTLTSFTRSPPSGLIK